MKKATLIAAGASLAHGFGANEAADFDGALSLADAVRGDANADGALSTSEISSIIAKAKNSASAEQEEMLDRIQEAWLGEGENSITLEKVESILANFELAGQPEIQRRGLVVTMAMLIQQVFKFGLTAAQLGITGAVKAHEASQYPMPWYQNSRNGEIEFNFYYRVKREMMKADGSFWIMDKVKQPRCENGVWRYRFKNIPEPLPWTPPKNWVDHAIGALSIVGEDNPAGARGFYGCHGVKPYDPSTVQIGPGHINMVGRGPTSTGPTSTSCTIL